MILRQILLPNLITTTITITNTHRAYGVSTMIITTITIIIPITTQIFIGTQAFPLIMAQVFILAMIGGILIIVITVQAGITEVIITTDIGDGIMVMIMAMVMAGDIITGIITAGAIITTAIIPTIEILTHIHLMVRAMARATADIIIIAAETTVRQLVRQEAERAADVRLPSVMSVHN
jgi:hypothetical protein